LYQKEPLKTLQSPNPDSSKVSATGKEPVEYEKELVLSFTKYNYCTFFQDFEINCTV